MAKKLAFDNLSTKECSHKGCTKHIKQRLVNDKPTADICYKHHKQTEALRGHTVDSQARRARVDAGLPVKSY